MTKSETVYNYIREQILSGALAPGSRIKNTSIVETLHVSRTPVREALKQLEAENLVRLVHNSSAEVRAFDLDEMEQIIMIRQELEPLAAKLAAQNCDEATLRKLRRMVDDMEVLRLAGDAEKYSHLNREFHMAVYRSGGSPVLVELISDLWNRSERSMLIFSLFPRRLEESNEEHRELLKALENHDPDQAQAVLRRQKEAGFINVLRILKTCKSLIP